MNTFSTSSNMLSSSIVSVVIPCLNEEKYIAKCLDSFLDNDFNKNFLEIIIVDGRSTDKTIEIINDYCNKYSFIRLIDNPKRKTAAAVNLGIKAASGNIILRADAHTLYSKNYISTLAEGIGKYQADNIGGLRETMLVRDNPLSLAISIAISHPFVAGNALYRTGSSVVEEVDTVFCGCFHRQLFDKIGFFNESIVRNEDREFNARIVANGGKIILDPRTSCTYFPRTNFWEYIKWNTYGIFMLFYNHKFTDFNMIALRNFVPAFFLVWHILAIVLFFITPILGLLASLPLILYWPIVLILSAQISFQQRSISLFPAIFLVFTVTHYSYGIGSLLGIPYYLLERIKKCQTI